MNTARVNRIIAIGLALLLSVQLVAGVRVGSPAGVGFSGGGVNPIGPPPNANANLGQARLTHITVNSRMSTGPWIVEVRTVSGTLIASATAINGELVTKALPAGQVLMLDVLDTDALDVPIAAGQTVGVWVP